MYHFRSHQKLKKHIETRFCAWAFNKSNKIRVFSCTARISFLDKDKNFESPKKEVSDLLYFKLFIVFLIIWISELFMYYNIESDESFYYL